MILSAQWKLLDAMAENYQKNGSIETAKQLRECSATIKELWIECHQEMVDAFRGNADVVGAMEVTIEDYKMFLRQKCELFK